MERINRYVKLFNKCSAKALDANQKLKTITCIISNHKKHINSWKFGNERKLANSLLGAGGLLSDVIAMPLSIIGLLPSGLFCNHLLWNKVSAIQKRL